MMVMLPPIANPKVTAGFKWPPEMLAAIETPTKSANAWAIATATNPAGSSAASAVSLPEKFIKLHYTLDCNEKNACFHFIWFKKEM